MEKVYLLFGNIFQGKKDPSKRYLNLCFAVLSNGKITTVFQEYNDTIGFKEEMLCDFKAGMLPIISLSYEMGMQAKLEVTELKDIDEYGEITKNA